MYNIVALIIGKTFFADRAVNVWNDLPSEVIQSSSINMFKNRLNQHNLRVYCMRRSLMT